MFFHNIRHKTLWFRAISMALVWLFILNDISWAVSSEHNPSNQYTLAAESRFNPFFKAHTDLYCKNKFLLYLAASELRNLAISQREVRDSDIARLNMRLKDAEVEIVKDAGKEQFIETFPIKGTNRTCRYAVFNFKKNNVKVQVVFPENPSTLTANELEELGIRTEQDKDYFFNSGLNYVWLRYPKIPNPVTTKPPALLSDALPTQNEGGVEGAMSEKVPLPQARSETDADKSISAGSTDSPGGKSVTNQPIQHKNSGISAIWRRAVFAVRRKFVRSVSADRAIFEVSPQNYRHNLEYIRGVLDRDIPGRKVKMCVVMKSDAYAYGIANLISQAVDFYPAYIAAIHNKDFSIIIKEIKRRRKDISLLRIAPVDADELRESLSNGWNIEEMVCSLEEAEMISDIADELSEKMGRNITVGIHINIETGLGYSDFRNVDEMREAINLPHLKLKGVMTHFANSVDESEATAHERVRAQIDKFNDVVDNQLKLDKAVIRHIAASESVLKSPWQHIEYPEAMMDMVRIGSIAFGEDAETYDYKNGIVPVINSFKTKVILIQKDVPPGTGISYDHEQSTRKDKPSIIADIAIGYNEGFPKMAYEGGVCVFIKGKAYPIISRACMNVSFVDITDQDPNDPIQVGDEVVIIGRQKGKERVLLELAEALDMPTTDIILDIGHANKARLPANELIKKGFFSGLQNYLYLALAITIPVIACTLPFLPFTSDYYAVFNKAHPYILAGLIGFIINVCGDCISQMLKQRGEKKEIKNWKFDVKKRMLGIGVVDAFLSGTILLIWIYFVNSLFGEGPWNIGNILKPLAHEFVYGIFYYRTYFFLFSAWKKTVEGLKIQEQFSLRALRSSFEEYKNQTGKNEVYGWDLGFYMPFHSFNYILSPITFALIGGHYQSMTSNIILLAANAAALVWVVIFTTLIHKDKDEKSTSKSYWWSKATHKYLFFMKRVAYGYLLFINKYEERFWYWAENKGYVRPVADSKEASLHGETVTNIATVPSHVAPKTKSIKGGSGTDSLDKEQAFFLPARLIVENRSDKEDGEKGNGGTMGRWKYESSIFYRDGTLILYDVTRIPRKDRVAEEEFLIEKIEGKNCIILKTRELNKRERARISDAIDKLRGMQRNIIEPRVIIRDESAICNRIYGVATGGIPFIREDIIKNGDNGQVAEAIDHENMELTDLDHDTIRTKQYKGGLRALITELSNLDKAEKEAGRIHNENLKYTPAEKDTHDKTVICQVITDSIVPVGQRDMIQKIGQYMAKPEKNCVERMARLEEGKPGSFLDKLREVIADQERLNAGYETEYYIACASKNDVETVLENIPMLEKEFGRKLKMRAVAFEVPEPGIDAVQVEGIMLVLRALRKGSDSLRAVYKFLTGKDMDIETDDLIAMMKKALFKVPSAKIEINKVSDFNKLVEKYIKNAA